VASGPPAVVKAAPGGAEYRGMSVLAVVPACLRDQHDAELLGRCLVSLWRTAPGVPAIVVDASPAGGSDQLAAVCAELSFELLRLEGRASFARAANAGLAIAEGVGADAVVVHHDVELLEPGWLDALVDARGDIVGGRLLFPDGTLQHCGYLYSQLHARFAPRMLFGPADLPGSLEPAVCPVGAALTLIRHDALVALGGFDEGYLLGGEDVDLCLRAFAAGGACVYEPRAVALHHNVAWRGIPDGDRERLAAASQERLLERFDESARRPFALEAS
jgi:GT2 family glycosyltransferase